MFVGIQVYVSSLNVDKIQILILAGSWMLKSLSYISPLPFGNYLKDYKAVDVHIGYSNP